MEIKYGPSGNVSLEVFDGVVALYGELLEKSTQFANTEYNGNTRGYLKPIYIQTFFLAFKFL